MADGFVRLAVLLLRPAEAWHSWRWKKRYHAGKFRREWSPVQQKAAVTTKRDVTLGTAEGVMSPRSTFGRTSDVTTRSAA